MAAVPEPLKMAPARTKDDTQTKTGEGAIPKERGEQYVVRLPAQGGGLQESITLNQLEAAFRTEHGT